MHNIIYMVIIFSAVVYLFDMSLEEEDNGQCPITQNFQEGDSEGGCKKIQIDQEASGDTQAKQQTVNKEDMKALFDMFDVNKDEHLSISELKDLYESQGQAPTTEHLQLIIKGVDTDGSGTLDFSEFLTQITGRMEYPSREDEIETFGNAFVMFDKDSDGLLTTTELKDAMGILGGDMPDETVEAMVKHYDIDKDNHLDRDEFTQMMKSEN